MQIDLKLTFEEYRVLVVILGLAQGELERARQDEFGGQELLLLTELNRLQAKVQAALPDEPKIAAVG